MKTFLTRHALIAFFVLAYALSWFPILFSVDGLNPFGPLLAAIIIAFLIGGKEGLKEWWKYVTRWRGGLGWYALAILLPFTINFAAAALAVLLGAQVPTQDKIARWPELFITFPLYLIAFGPLGEEPGWRGFAMPRLIRNRTALSASLLLGIFVAIWHLPLVMTGQQPGVMLLAVIASQIMYTWLANHVEGKVLIVMLAHAAQGGLGGEYFGAMFTGADAQLESILLVAVQIVVAVAIVLLKGLRQPSHQPAKTTEDMSAV